MADQHALADAALMLAQVRCSECKRRGAPRRLPSGGYHHLHERVHQLHEDPDTRCRARDIWMALAVLEVEQC